MLDVALFNVEMKILEDRFNHQVSEVVLDLYYEMLQDLDGQEFRTACRMAFRENRFFPSPQELIDKVRPSSMDLAVLEWDAIMAAVREETDRPELSEPAKASLTEIGSYWDLRQADRYELSRLRKQFMEAYATRNRLSQLLQLSPAIELQLTGRGRTEQAQIQPRPEAENLPTLTPAEGMAIARAAFQQANEERQRQRQNREVAL